MRQYTGLIQIEGAEFWGWVQNYLNDSDTVFITPEFTMKDVILATANGVKKFIPSEVFWGWVIKNYLPCSPDESSCNNPVWNDKNQSLDIEFAAGSIHPSQWLIKPHWLQD